MQQFNQALLAKQGWRLIHNDSSLVARVLKGKYHPRTPFLEAKIGHNSSFTWKSILEARTILTDGSIWRVGDGLSINIWTDKWLPDIDHNHVFTTSSENTTEQLVSTLIDQERRVWKSDLITKLFLPLDIPHILSIPLSRRHIHDTLIWPYTKDATYSVCSGYYWLRDQKDINQATSSTVSTQWKKLWKLVLPPKIKIFLWRLLHNALSYKLNLQRRGITLPVNCSSCDQLEDLNHVFARCEWAVLSWFHYHWA